MKTGYNIIEIKTGHKMFASFPLSDKKYLKYFLSFYRSKKENGAPKYRIEKEY